MKGRILSILGVQSPRIKSELAYDYLTSTLSDKLSDKKFDLLILPEKWIIDQLSEKSKLFLSILSFFNELSVEKEAIIVPGSFSVKREDGLYNSSPVIDFGKLAGWQDKISLFKDENGNYAKGKEVKTFKTSLLTLSVAVCYDADFPYFSKIAAKNGSEVIVNPSLIHEDFHDMWYIYVKGRSLENRLPFFSINSISEPFSGNSILTVPKQHNWGVKLEEINAGSMPTISLDVDLQGIREMADRRLKEDPGNYSLNQDKLV